VRTTLLTSNGHRTGLGEVTRYREWVLSSDKSTWYQVTWKQDGSWECECQGWHYRGTCRHIDRVKEKFADPVGMLRNLT
jgi:hypothetical protein